MRSIQHEKPIRVGAIIETAYGVLVVQDLKDKGIAAIINIINERLRRAIEQNDEKGTKDNLIRRLHLARQITAQGRFSLPGGKLERADYEMAGAGKLLTDDTPRSRWGSKEIDLFRRVVHIAIGREIEEELGLKIDPMHILDIMEINGRTRDHVICLVQAVNRDIILNTSELCGIGFLDKQNILPLNSYFYQQHLRDLVLTYIRNKKRDDRAKEYLSRLSVPLHLMEQWQRAQVLGYGYRRLGQEKSLEISPPIMPKSTPNFTVVGSDGDPIVGSPIDETDNNTRSLRAKIVRRTIPIPVATNQFVTKHTRKTSPRGRPALAFTSPATPISAVTTQRSRRK